MQTRQRYSNNKSEPHSRERNHSQRRHPNNHTKTQPALTPTRSQDVRLHRSSTLTEERLHREIDKLNRRIVELEKVNTKLRQENDFLVRSQSMMSPVTTDLSDRGFMSSTSSVPSIENFQSDSSEDEPPKLLSRPVASKLRDDTRRDQSPTSRNRHHHQSSYTRTAIITQPEVKQQSQPQPHIPMKSYRYTTDSVRVYEWYEQDEEESSKVLGRGRHGIVVGMFNKRTQQHVAVKKNKKVFATLVHARHILREIRVLRHFDHENLVQLVDVIVPNEDCKDIFEDVCLVFETMETTLGHVIAHAHPLEVPHVKFIVYQVLCGLQHMHSAGIMHRDIKPDNILINSSDCSAKICDFGMARPFIVTETQKPATEYEVFAQFYRCPELLVGNQFYGPEVDVWAMGCTVAELFSQQILFRGMDRSHEDQLKTILRTLGTPDDLTWIEDGVKKNSIAWMLFGDDDENKIVPAVNWSDLLPRCDGLGLEFFQDMLRVNPSERPSVNELLHRPWLEDELEETHLTVCSPFELFEGVDESLDNLFKCRKRIYAELRSFSPRTAAQ